MDKEDNKGIVLELTFLDQRDGKDLIARSPKGKICFLNRNHEATQWVKHMETWECQILFEKDSFMVVDPLKLLVKAKENKHDFSKAIKKLTGHFNKGRNGKRR